MRRVDSLVKVGLGPSKLGSFRYRSVSRGFICGACRSVGTVETRDRRRALTLTTLLDVPHLSRLAAGAQVVKH
jgi:hypothetical protein